MSEEARIAAKWWADQLRSDPDHDTGDASLNSQLKMISGIFGGGKSKGFSDESIALFEKTLHETIVAQLANLRYPVLLIGVDYHPDEHLSDAAEKAGLGDSFNRLPFKTRMRIESGSVKVAEGYGAAFIELMGRDEEQIAQDMQEDETKRLARQLKQALDAYDKGQSAS